MDAARDPSLQAFRDAVVAKIRRDLEDEDQRASRYRSEVMDRLGPALERARSAGRCGRAWLYGSFAWGKPTAESDVDILVEGCDSPDSLAAELWTACDRPVHLVQVERAPESLLDRARREGRPL